MDFGRQLPYLDYNPSLDTASSFFLFLLRNLSLTCMDIQFSIDYDILYMQGLLIVMLGLYVSFNA